MKEGYETPYFLTTEEISAIASISQKLYGQSKEMGWYDNSREVGTMLMLMVSELAEAMEGDRKGLMDDKLPHRPMFEVELADCVIRILDYAAKRGLDIAGAIAEKHDYNWSRPDHQKDNRAKEGGKKY
jgi:NTP pyrophosphatase (non-canonical NTP hydrolase)